MARTSQHATRGYNLADADVGVARTALTAMCTLCGIALIPYVTLAASTCPLQGELAGARLLDLSPTLLELGGYDRPSSMQGRSLISGEMIFVSLGLGQLLMMGRDLNDMSQVIAVMVLIIAIGVWNVYMFFPLSL